MNDIDDDPPPKRRGCFKSCAVGLFGLLFVLTLVVWGGRAAVRKQGERRLLAATRDLDAAEPGWTLDKHEAGRAAKFPPPGQSSAPLILEVADEVPKEWKEWSTKAEWVGRIENHLRPDADVDALKAVDEVSRPVRAKAAQLRDRTPGGFSITHAANPFATLLPHVDKVRNVAALVQYDGLLAAATGQPDVAVRDAMILLNVARSLADEPYLISQLVRVAIGKIAANAAFQALAWGEPAAGLADLQAAFWAEAEAPKLLPGLLGERASIHQLFDALETGRMPIEDVFKMMDGKPPAFWQSGGMRLYKAMLPGDHAESLRVFNELIAAAKLPPHQQLVALKQVKMPGRPPDEFRYLLTSLFIPAVDRVGEATIRNRADLYAASVAVAVERHRRQTGRWPGSLDEIPKDILPAVPTDPFDGGPLKFQAMPDGVAVYSVGPPVDERTPQARRTGPLNGDGLGWRLYDADKRRLPAKPVVPDAENGP